MTDAEFFTELERILELGEGTILGNEKMQDLPGWDSLAIMGVIAIIDQKIGKAISATSLASCKTVKELTKLVTGNTSTP